jgi:hypothetical protein
MRLSKLLSLSLFSLFAFPQLTLASSSEAEVCEATFERSTSTGVLTRHINRGWADLDFSATDEGVLTLDGFSIVIDGIPQTSRVRYSDLKNVSIQLEKLPEFSTGVGNPGDVAVKRNRLHVFSEVGSAVFDLTAGGKIQRVVDVQFVNEKTLEGRDPHRIPLPQLLHILGFSAELKQAALKALDSPCAEEKRLPSVNLLKHLLSAKLAYPADLGCPPCALELEPQAHVVRPWAQ